MAHDGHAHNGYPEVARAGMNLRGRQQVKMSRRSIRYARDEIVTTGIQRTGREVTLRERRAGTKTASRETQKESKHAARCQDGGVYAEVRPQKRSAASAGGFIR